MKIPAKKPVIDLLAREVVNGYLFDLRGVQLPNDGVVNIYESIDNFRHGLQIGKARVVYKYGKIIAQIDELNEKYFDRYLEITTSPELGCDNVGYFETEKCTLQFLHLSESKKEGSCILSIREQLEGKNHIQDFFTVEEINRLCKLYKVGVLEISDYTGIQYNSLHQYLGGDKSKPTLPLSKVVRAALFLYFKAVFNHKY